MKRVLSIVFLAIGASTCAFALNLTGIALFSADTSGNPSGGQRWNTLGGDVTYNLYLRQGAAWVNSGNGAEARIDVPLTPGVHFFDIYGQPGSGSHFGISLMFDGTDNAPRIAAHNPSAGSDTGFSVTSSGSVYDLNSVLRPTPNSLSYSSGGLTATLTKFIYMTPTIPPVQDLVQGYNNIPGGGNDCHGVIELTVVPEPSSMLVLGAGAACSYFARRRRRSIELASRIPGSDPVRWQG